MWKLLNGVLNKCHKPTVLPDTGDVKDDIPEILNNFNIYVQYLTGNYLRPFFLKPTDSNELFKIIMDLKSSNTAGIDGNISTILKKNCHCDLGAPRSLQQPFPNNRDCIKNGKKKLQGSYQCLNRVTKTS